MSAEPVVVVGEALVDLVPEDDGALHPRLGGAPFNVARALCRLGQPATFVGRISTDAFGQQLAAALAGDGVNVACCLRDPRPTSLALAEIDAQRQATYQFYFAESAAEALDVSTALAAAATEGHAFYAGGLGLVLEPLAEATENLLSVYGGARFVFLDPNVRPSAIPDMPSYRSRLRRVLQLADVVKVSDADLAVLSPDEDAETAAKRMLAQGPKLVLLTLGARGAVAVGSFGHLEIPAPSVSVADTIGSGDAFSAAWLAEWLATGGDLASPPQVRRVTEFAAAAAAFSCERAGSSSLTRAELAGRLAALEG